MFLGLLILVLFVTVLFLWDDIRSMKGRVSDLERRSNADLRLQVDVLEHKVAALESALTGGVRQAPVTANVEIRTPVTPKTLPVLEPTRGTDAQPAGHEPKIAPVREPVPLLTAVPSMATASPIAAVSLDAPVVPAVAAAAVVGPASSAARVSTPPATDDPAPEREAWEVVVGTSWLNKIGVLVFVTGVALLLGYSMAHVGPLGRVGIGMALSAGLLGAGVVLERRETYRHYAYGLIAGGWAGLYVTTFAAHAIPAARVIDSELLGTTSLLVVAAGMIAHSLRYRSQTVTALAYLSAYGPLAFSPLSGFSLFASVPLVVSLIAIATRFSWLGVAVFGLVSSYGLFALRAHPLTSAVDPRTVTPYLVLASYWIAFELADAIAARRPGGRYAGLFAMNAAALLGSILLILPAGDNTFAAVAAAVIAVAYLTTALVRARLLPPAPVLEPQAARTAFTTVHAAVALAAALFAAAILLSTSGARETALLLLEAELLFLAGVALADRPVRFMGGAVALCVVMQAITTWSVQFGPAVAGEPSSWLNPTIVAILAACVWYGNHEWVLRRSNEVDSPEVTYSWASLLMLGSVIVRELPVAHQGLTGLVLATVLVEAGLRRASAYRFQAYVAGAASVWAIVATYALARTPSLRQAWLVLPAAVAIAYAGAWRLSRAAKSAEAGDVAPAAGLAAWAGTLLLAIFEWWVVPADFLGLVWAATAGAVLATGARTGVASLRWQSYVLALVAGIYGVLPLTTRVPDGFAAKAAIAGVIAILFATSYYGRRLAAATTDRSNDAEIAATGLLAFLANLSQALFTWRVVPPVAVAPVWAASAVTLVTLGLHRGKAAQRWQGYALLLVAMLRAVAPMALRGLNAPGDGLAVGLVIASLYAVGALGRRTNRAGSGSRTDVEEALVAMLPWFATVSLAILERELVPSEALPLAWTASALTLLAIGLWRPDTNTRFQGYALAGAGALVTLGAISAPNALAGSAVAFAGAAVALLYTAGLIGRLRAGVARTSPEEQGRIALLIVATLLLAVLIVDTASRTVVTLAWGFQGAALLTGGFLMRERTLRLLGLALLFFCILKLFVYDLRQLEALARIVSFVALGLVLLAVSWIYTRYREQIRRLL